MVGQSAPPTDVHQVCFLKKRVLKPYFVYDDSYAKYLLLQPNESLKETIC